MSAGQFHTLRVEYTDGAGRRWCATCLLPHTNSKAVKAHTPPVREDPTKRRLDRD